MLLSRVQPVRVCGLSTFSRCRSPKVPPIVKSQAADIVHKGSGEPHYRLGSRVRGGGQAHHHGPSEGQAAPRREVAASLGCTPKTICVVINSGGKPCAVPRCQHSEEHGTASGEDLEPEGRHSWPQLCVPDLWWTTGLADIVLHPGNGGAVGVPVEIKMTAANELLPRSLTLPSYWPW